MPMIKSTAKKIVSSAIAFAMSISLSVVAVGAGALGITAISATGVGMSAANAAPINVVSNGWTLTVPDLNFTTSSWKFVLTPNSPNFLDDFDSVTLKLKDSKGKEIGSAFDYASMAKDPKLDFTMYVDASDFSKVESTSSFIATAEIKRGSSSKQANVNITFSVPTTSFPKRPVVFADYLSFSTDLSTLELPFPRDCEDLEFKYTVSDPFSEISDIDFSLKDAKGKEIASKSVYSSEKGEQKGDFSICDYTVKTATAPFSIDVVIAFDDETGKSKLSKNYKILNSKFPKRPVAFADYLSFSTDLTTLEMPFPKECEALEFKYTMNDPFSEISDIDFSLIDAKGEEIASESAYSSQKGEQKGDFSVCGYTIKDATAPFSIDVVITFDDETGKSNLSKNYKILNSKFPKRPVVFADYLTMKTDFANTEIPYPKSCTPFEYQYDLNDPYDEISSLDFSLLDGSGKSLASDFDFAGESKTQTGSISLCDFTIANAVGPFTLKATIKFSSSNGKPSLESVIPVKIENPAIKYLTALKAQGVVCVKGSTYSVAKSGKCPSGAKAVNFSEPTELQWNTLTRSPAQVKGKNFVIFGCVAQFDANTGGSKFRAYASKTPTASWLSGVNSMFSGNAKSLLKLKENDAFIAKVNVSGAISYSTIGNKTSVPSFAVRDFVKIGTC